MRDTAADEVPRVSGGYDGKKTRELPFRWPSFVLFVSWAAASAALFVTIVGLRTPRLGLLEGGADLDVYRDGARHVMEELPLYTEPFVHGLLYTYTPFSTLTFLPFGLLPGGTDKYIWLAVNIVLLAAIIAFCWRMLGYRITPYVLSVSSLLTIVCIFLEPVRTTLFYGQINLVLMALILWDTSRGEGSRLKGVGVGIAAGIKLTPGYFVLFYLALRQWRAAAVAAGTIAATVGVSWLVLPDDSRQYWTETFFNSSRIADDLHPANQSLRGVIARLIGEPAPTWLWLLTAAIVAAASMWVVVRLHRVGEVLLAVTVAGMSAAVISPFTWSHHWVWFVPLLVFLVHRALTNPWWWLGAAALFLVAGSWTYHFPDVAVVGLYLFPPIWMPWDVLVNLYLLTYAVVLGGAAVIAHRTARDQRLDVALRERADDCRSAG
ncbi:DUF2029 domain-containing protein [Rhodococcus sp. ABRD24]|uniref:glycosyltransferase 87 family protein n=1 Tax=Rhodococcus sp. ABRD24 TaxID=2507582 RepID=UPI00103B9376|nr:glycosyltransferase 87 family protein [Rhodococcus sp. ABRD24]QBJ94849.1 DUF2029 domain-containing protein [Rhodococcus sp. ABRD24]